VGGGKKKRKGKGVALKTEGNKKPRRKKPPFPEGKAPAVLPASGKGAVSFSHARIDPRGKG